ncbi:hypothetical protein ACFLQU_06055 [Verrucomicrobiota bacterium]
MNAKLLSALLAAVVLFAGNAFATNGNHTDTELRYAEGLFRLGCPDFANIVLDRLETTDAFAVRLKRFQLRLVSTGGIAWAKKKIAKEPPGARETWLLKLALADGHYAWGQHNEAFGIYRQFIERYSKTGRAEDLDLLTKTAHRYAQMLLLTGRLKESLKAYGSINLDKVERHVKRQLLAEQAELMVRICEDGDKTAMARHLPAAEKICDDLMLVQDLWGGKAIVVKAHIRLLQGQPMKAKEMLLASMSFLADLDRQLREESQ